jgi:hypothetical protein
MSVLFYGMYSLHFVETYDVVFLLVLVAKMFFYLKEERYKVASHLIYISGILKIIEVQCKCVGYFQKFTGQLHLSKCVNFCIVQFTPAHLLSGAMFCSPVAFNIWKTVCRFRSKKLFLHCPFFVVAHVMQKLRSNIILHSTCSLS